MVATYIVYLHNCNQVYKNESYLHIWLQNFIFTSEYATKPNFGSFIILCLISHVLLIAYTQAELCILKFIELNVQIKTYFCKPGHNYEHAYK